MSHSRVVSPSAQIDITNPASLQDGYTDLSKKERLPKILFFSDCYLEGFCWAAFHKSLIRNLAAASDSLLAIRANSFFKGGSIEPLSDYHLATVIKAIDKFKPDVVFSVNRTGLTPQILDAIPENTKIITLFIDFYDRCPEELKNFGKRDFIWGTGMGALKENFLSKYKNVLNEDQIEFTLWCSDTSTFRPLGLTRELDVSFVGTAFPTETLANLLVMVSPNKKNRQILVDLYFAHREHYVYDLVKELFEREFDFSLVDERVLPTLMSNSLLQAIFSDQISGEQRINYLAALDKVNLAIYGEPQGTWLHLICSVNANLLSRFKFEPIREEADLVTLYNKSKIGLNVQHDHARDTGISIRAFDIIASKTLLMTQSESIIPFKSIGFIDGEDFVSFSSPEDLKQKCAYFLENDEERERIIESAFHKLRSGHTLRHRMAIAFAKAGFFMIAERFLTLEDKDITDISTSEKIFCLDHFAESEKIGKDYNKIIEQDEVFSFNSYLNPGELAVQFNSFRLVIPLYAVPLPGLLKRAGKQFLKQSARAVYRLARLCKWRLSMVKLPD